MSAADGALCVGGCGFYGSPNTMGMCSVCFKKQGNPTPDPEPEPETETAPAAPQDRCFACHKKLRLAQRFACKCCNTFCATHRDAASHTCTFDYKSEAMRRIEEKNPEIKASKMDKI